MKKRGRLRKGLAMLLTATMVVGLMPGAGTMKVSAAEGEASGSVAAAEGYDANGFCTSYELTNGTWALKSDVTMCATHGETCNGYQPATLTTGTHEVDGISDTKDDVYEITNAGQLYWFAGKVNNDNTNYKSANAVLTANITVNENVLVNGDLNPTLTNPRSWTPIGNNKSQYTGTFDGNHKTISGLYLSDTSTNFIGLFGYVGNGGKICDVGVVDSYFNGKYSVSGVCSYNYGTITSCYNTSRIICNQYEAGGVCASNFGVIENCYNAGEISGTGGNESYFGGVCARNLGITRKSYNTGRVSGTGHFFGGVCGNNYGYTNSALIENCYNTGEVNGTAAVSEHGIEEIVIGGVCGWNTAEGESSVVLIKNCHNTGYISETASNKGTVLKGSVCGSSIKGTINNCYFLTGTDNAALGDDSNSSVKDVLEKDNKQFASGEVAWLLNGKKSEGTEANPLVWYQNINEETADASPTFDTSHEIVYASEPCPIEYTNTSAKKIEHTYFLDTEDKTKHICEKCAYSAAHSTEKLSYEADDVDDTITVTCGECNEDLGTISLSAPSETITYDGNAKEAVISNNVTGVTIDTPTITYKKDETTLTSAPINAGTYTASITLGTGGGATTVSVEFTIEKAIWKSLCGNVVANESIRGKADGKWKIIIADNDTEAERKAKLEYKLKSEDDSEYKEVSGDSIENLAAGTYSIRRMEDDNHKPDYRSSNEFIIEPGRYLTVSMPKVTLANYGYEVSCAALSAKNYNLEWHEGYSFEINIDEKNYHRGKGYKVLVNDKEIQETDGVYVVPGSSVETDQKVEVQGVEKHTCLYVTSESKDSIIEKCSYCEKETGTVTITAPEAPVYDGRAKEATIAGAFTQNQDTPEIKYAEYKDATETYESLDTAKPINAGKYQASITVEGATATVTYEIDKASLKNYVTVVPYEGVYDGSGHGISVTVSETAPDSNDEAVIRYRTNEEENYSEEKPLFTDAGTYTVYYKVSKNKYYDLEGESKVVITQKPVTVTAEDKTKTYGQENPAFTFTVPDGALVASDTKEDLAVVLNCLATASSPVTAEGYAITGTSDSTNYNVTVTPGTLTINKADATITVGTTSYDKTFGDADFPLEGISDTNTEADVQYEVTAGNDVVSVSNGTVTILKAGTATITVSLPASTNYNAAENKTITVTVNKAASAPNKPNSTMNVDYGKEKVSDITSLPEGWVWQYADKEKALTVGTAVAATAVYTGADAGNYETETVEISITRAECTHATTEVKNAKDTTCTGKGYSGDTCCTVCGKVITAGADINALGHDFAAEFTVDKEATCTEAGSKSKHCSRCEEKTEVTPIPKKEHTWDSGAVTKEATCTEKGVLTYTCEVCQETKTEDIAIDKSKHGETEIKDAKEATCTEKGYTGDNYCKDCGEKVKTGQDIDALGHDFAAEFTVDKEATCTEAGSKSKHCSRCEEKTEVTTIPEKGHTWDAGKVTKEATETAEGVKTYTCSVCGKTKTEAIPKKTATTQEPLKKGDVVKDDKAAAKVEVTDAKKKEVAYEKPANKKAKPVSIPATVKIDGVTYKVTKIADNAFKGNKTVTKVTVGSNIKTIGKNAFSGATKLKTVKIGKNVTEVGTNAFKGCSSLTSVTLPGKTTKIGANAFNGCKKLKTIKIISTKISSKTVAKNAFKGLTKATTIKVPKKKLAAYKRLFKQKGLSSKVKVKGY